MKMLLLPLLLVTVTLLIPASATPYDNSKGVDANGNKQNTESNASDCTPQLDVNCNIDINPFASYSKKDSDDKRNTESNVSDCTPQLDVNCNTDVESTSTPDNTITNSKGVDIAKIVFVDYKKPKSIHTGPAGDVCGDGTGKYATLSGGIKWNSFPVPYTIDVSSSGIDSTAAKAAVKAAFNTIDDEEHPAGDFFVLTTSNPKITVKWANIDGTGSILAQTTTYYNTASKTIVKADIVFDSGDKWSVNSNFGCGGGGSSFDVQDVATHELGHAIGLGHVTDNLLTMYKYASPGETLKSSLGRGDQRGIDKLY
jgi:predicted Zn-dependent protease